MILNTTKGFPENVTLDFGNDGINEYTGSGVLNSTTSPITIEEIIKCNYSVNIFYKNMIQKMISQYPDLKNEQYGKDNDHEHNQYIINGLINYNKFDELLKYKNFKLDLIDSIHHMVYYCKNDNVLKHIIDNTLNLEYMDGKSPLVHYICVNKKHHLIKYIVDKEIDLECKDSSGWTVMNCAAYYSTFETIKYIIEKDVDLNSTINKFNGREKQYTVIDLINLNEKLDSKETDELMDILKEKGCKFVTDNISHQSNQVIIDQIMKQNNYEKLKKYNDFNFGLLDRSQLIVFLKDPKNIDIIKYVIDNILNIQETNDNGYYLMHEICKHSFPEAIKYAVDRGWDLETSCKTGYRSMHFIFRYQEPELIKQVLDMDIDLDLAAGDGWRPIHYLCKYSTMEMVKYILDKGVDLKSDLVKQNGELNNYDFEDRIKNNNKINVEDQEELLDLITQKN